MEEILVRALRARRGAIRVRWEALLRLEPATTALAHPDMLVHSLTGALDEIFSALAPPVHQAPAAHEVSPPSAAARLHPACACGRNPFLAFFLAGEQAMLEALVLVQADLPAIDPVARDTAVAELYVILRRLRNRELDAFCSLCQRGHNPSALEDRHLG